MPIESPSEKSLFFNGAVYSVNATIADAVLKNSYLDSRNARYMASDTNDLAMVKIKGEDLKYPNIYNEPGGDLSAIGNQYACLCGVRVAEHIFEIWVDETRQGPCFFRLDGKIVAMSADIPFDIDHPIQWDKNDGVGGEVFLTDFNAMPHIYSVVDLFENAGYNGKTGLDDGSQTATAYYFDDYNPDNFTINIKLPADHPMFLGCMSVNTPPPGAQVIGDGTGMDAGSYVYTIRLKDETGNATNKSEGTPPIPVPKSIANDATVIFGQITKTLGASEGVATAYGNWIKFRVSNFLNFTAFEILRTRWTADTIPYRTPGVEEIIFEGPIGPGEISIKSIFDTGAEGTLIASEDNDPLAVIERAKTLRYFDQALYLFNTEFANRESEVTYVTSPDVFYPVMKNMGREGHYDSVNNVYYRSDMHCDRKGFAIQLRGLYGERPFVVPVTGACTLYPNCGTFENFTFPSRRDALQTAYSSIGTSSVAALADYTTGFSFETFLQVFTGLKAKTNTDRHSISTGLYLPLHPISETDSKSDHNFKVNNTTSDVVGYTAPAGFNLEYLSLGARFGGLATFPDWTAAFTVMQAPADRVVCQAIGMYSLNPNDGSNPATKDLDTLWISAPDIDNGFVDAADIMNNPTNYEVQIVSALGFHEEVYHGHTDTYDNLNDLILYARILLEDGTVNTGDNTGNVGETGYVSHRKYRNATPATVWGTGDKGNTVFSILSMNYKLTTPTSPNQRSTFFEIRLNHDIYANADSNGNQLFDESGTREFHEPFFVVNILRKGANVDQSASQQTFYPTPAYVKIQSVVARQGDYGTTQATSTSLGGGSNNADVSGIARYRYELIDERPEDCCTVAAADVSFVYIRDPKGAEKPWLNFTKITGSPSTGNRKTILDALVATGFYQGALSNNIKVYGIYEHEYQGSIPSTGSQAKTYYLDFGQFTTAYGSGNIAALLAGNNIIPPTGHLIVVRYDKTKPVNVFGGEHFVGENVACFIDGKDNDPETGNDVTDQFRLEIGMPYYNMQGQTFYDNLTDVNLDYIRQMVVMACLTTRAMIPYTFSGAPATTALFSYPKVHYIMRPILWDPALNCADNGIDPQYQTDFPDLFDSAGLPIDWDRGGFRFYNGPSATNVQYSQRNSNVIGISKPTTNFTEVSEFETGIVWSVKREIGQQDSPNLKSFPGSHFRAISDKSGAIMKAFSAWTGRGNNLYAFTENGICLLLTNKFVAQGADGQPITTILAQGAQSIVQEDWLSETIGIPDEMWRTFAENGNNAFFVNKQSVFKFINEKAIDIGSMYYHARIYKDMIRLMKPQFYDHVTSHYNEYHKEYWVFWKQKSQILYLDTEYRLTPEVTINPHSFFMPGVAALYDSLFYEVLGGAATRIYLPKKETGILSVILRHSAIGTPASISVRDGNTDLPVTSGSLVPGQSKSYVRTSLTDDAWVATNLTTDPRTKLQKFLFVYHDDESKPSWVGRFDYDHDQFVSDDNHTYGMKDAKTFELGSSGYLINDALLQWELLGTTVGEDFNVSKDFSDIRINTQKKIADDGTTVVNPPPSSAQFFHNLSQERNNLPQTVITTFNNRHGFASHIPRMTGTIKDRMQGNCIIWKVIESSANDFAVSSVEVWFKNLEL